MWTKVQTVILCTKLNLNEKSLQGGGRGECVCMDGSL